MKCGQLCVIVDINVDNLCIVVDDADHMFEMIYAPKTHDVNHQIPRGTHQPTCPEDRLTLSATTMADWIRQIFSLNFLIGGGDPYELQTLFLARLIIIRKTRTIIKTTFGSMALKNLI